MRLFILILALLAMTMAGGCVTKNTGTNIRNTMETAQFIGAGINLSKTYKDMETLIEAKLGRFEHADQESLLKVKANLRSMIGMIEGWGSLDTATITISPKAIERVYTLAKENYLIAKEIIGNNKDLFTPMTRLRQDNFDASAALLDTRFTLMESRPEIVDTGSFIIDAVALGIDLGKIIVPLIKEM